MLMSKNAKEDDQFIVIFGCEYKRGVMSEEVIVFVLNPKI